MTSRIIAAIEIVNGMPVSVSLQGEGRVVYSDGDVSIPISTGVIGLVGQTWANVLFQVENVIGNPINGMHTQIANEQTRVDALNTHHHAVEKRRSSFSQLLECSTEERLSSPEPCPVCFEDFSVMTKLKKCGHRFCSGCIDSWTAVNDNCPVCRGDNRSVRRRM